MKYRFLAIFALGQLIAPLLANAELVRSSTSVLLTFRQCVSGETVCDSIGPMQTSLYDGLPGDVAAQASQDEPEFGASEGQRATDGNARRDATKRERDQFACHA